MTDAEIAAVHEAAHAAFATLGPWTRLAGPVALQRLGEGDVVMGTDGPAIGRALAADPSFDPDLPRLDLVRALLAGPVAERLLVERGKAALTEADLAATSAGDYDVVAEQLACLAAPGPDLAALEREVRRRLEEPGLWSLVERFAAILLDRRSLPADEAERVLEALRAGGPVEGEVRSPRRPLRLGLLAFAAWEAWWAFDFVTAPNPDYGMHTVAALLFGAIIPGALAVWLGLTVLAVRLVRRNRSRRTV
jgi:hypothetical protein